MPVSIDALDPIEVESISTSVAKVDPELIVVFPYTIFSVHDKVSPSSNGLKTNVLSEEMYFTYKVILSTSELSLGKTTFTTFAVVPEVCPVIVFPINLSI